MGPLLAGYVRLVYRTSTVITEPVDFATRFEKVRPFIMGCWHGQFLCTAVFKPKDLRVAAMVARHHDAELIAAVQEQFGIELVRGAGAAHRKRDRGGAIALRRSIRALAEGATFFMTADVPPGPARKAGRGIVKLAQKSGRPVVPIAVATSRYKAFSNWSRFTVNLPFSKMALVMGEPIWVASDLDPKAFEERRQLIEDSLNAVTKRCYELVGAVDPMAAGAATSAKPGLLLSSYQRLTRVGPLLVPLILALRRRRGKEDPARMKERYGIAGVKRPKGRLVWIHAASVGETNAVLPLLRKLHDDHPWLNFLLTTGTTTSAALAGKRLPERAWHQYVPVDVPQFVDRFLDHWRPDLALFVESEIWPNLLLRSAGRNIPVILVNGRMSKPSFKKWHRYAKSAQPLFASFAMILAQNQRFALHYIRLGAENIKAVGNLKLDAPPPPYAPDELARLERLTDGRPVFLAASTHPGEEEQIIAAHHLIVQSRPDLLTIIVPRHPERGDAIAAMIASQRNLTIAQRSQGAQPDRACQIYLADTLGELGLFYRLADAAFIGGSLVPHGGQNPIEPVMSGVPLLAGPHHFNFADIYKILLNKGGGRPVASAAELAQQVLELFDDPAAAQAQVMRARSLVAEHGGALERTLAALEPFLPPPPLSHTGITDAEAEDQAGSSGEGVRCAS